MAILLAGVIVGLAVYLKDKSSEPLRYIMLGTFLAGWGYIMVTEQGILTCTYIFPMMIALILYYDRKFEKRAFAGILACSVLRGIVLAVSGSWWGAVLMYLPGDESGGPEDRHQCVVLYGSLFP